MNVERRPAPAWRGAPVTVGMVGGGDGLVVASVPAGHPYVRHLSPPAGGTVTRLPDPDPRHPERQADGPWWPPVMLEPGWAASGDFDLMHVHFGFDDRTPGQLRDLIAALRRRRRPLVLTIHDLRSPHQVDPRVLDEQLDVLVPAADALITLTESAADDVARRWGRRPRVVPHPHVVDLASMARIRARRSAAVTDGVRRVGLAAKSLRRNTDPGRVLPALLRLAGPGVRLVVSIHRDVHDDPPTEQAVHLVGALRAAAAGDLLELVVHDPLGDAALWDVVADLDVVVLPYRFGTHSGWLEMCHDLGTAVVAPSFGHYAGQGVEGVYRAAETWVDDDSVVAAVQQALDALDRNGLPGRDVEQRREQRTAVAAAHDDIYAAALATARGAA